MRKLFALPVLLVVPFFLNDCASIGTRTIYITASEVEVIDGDTIHHGDYEYRLKGFDTPEIYSPKCQSEYDLGMKAKGRLANLIAENGGVFLRVDRKLDYHGRFLADASVSGSNVGWVLISEGLGRPYSGGKRQPWCSFVEMVGG